MAENTVVKEYLSPEMIEAGAQLVAELDKMGLSIMAALWLYDDEINEWRLLIGSSEWATSGSTGVYQKIRVARQALGKNSAVVPMLTIRLIDPNQELIRSFRKGMPTGPGVSRVRFKKSAIDGHYVDDALIYRIA